jgi:hypothetical protein
MKRKKTALIFVYLILIAAIALGAQNQTESVRVYVFTATDPGGFVDADAKQRSDSVEDLKRDLSKDSAIQIISGQATADVTLEVLGRGHEETGSTTSTQDYYGQWHTYPDTVRVVRVGLRAGAYTTLFEGTSSFAQRGLVGVSQGLWRVAASGAAKGIENWIRANHTKLLSKRSDVQTATGASRESCIQDTRTPICRTAHAKAIEARLRQKSPDVTVTVEGTDSDALVVEAGGGLFDDPVIRDPSKREEFEKALCLYAYKRVVIVNPSDLARYEFQVNCPTNSQVSNSDSTMMPRPEPARIPQEESGAGGDSEATGRRCHRRNGWSRSQIRDKF